MCLDRELSGGTPQLAPGNPLAKGVRSFPVLSYQDTDACRENVQRSPRPSWCTSGFDGLFYKDSRFISLHGHGEDTDKYLFLGRHPKIERIVGGNTSMDDPELQGDEQILIRTQGVHVKSISFEAILTSKRIILVDRLKNILPPKEIPLATIQSIEGGENAIRDLVITLGVITKTGGARQMVLTFSREGGGNRVKERDEWVRQIRAHLTPSFEQVVRKVIPGIEIPPAEPNKAAPQSFGPVGSPASPLRPSEFSLSVKKIVDNPPESWQAPSPAPKPVPETVLGTYCTKCGTKVPEESEFCNKCGSRIVRPGETHQGQPSAAGPSIPESPARKEHPIDHHNQSIEPLIEKSPDTVPTYSRSTAREEPHVFPPGPPEPVSMRPVVPDHPVAARAVPAAAPQAKKRFMPKLFSPKDMGPTPLIPSSMPTAVPPPPKKPKNRKKILLVAGILVILLIAVVAVVVVLPKIGSLGNALHSSTVSAPAAPTTAPGTTTSASSTNTTVVLVTQTPVSIPQTGVYVYVKYLGGWKGTYGTSDNQVQDTDSGERTMEVVNATGTVTASFAKLDSSSHAITVSIYKNGKVLTSSSTTAPGGKVTLSVDTTTGVAQQPVVSGTSGTTAANTTNVVKT